MVNKPKAHAKQQALHTKPANVYDPGDALPVPEVSEKNTDSVWALWSDLVEGRGEKDATEKPDSDTGGDTVPATLLMGLPEHPEDEQR